MSRRKICQYAECYEPRANHSYYCRWHTEQAEREAEIERVDHYEESGERALDEVTDLEDLKDWVREYIINRTGETP